LGFGAGLAGAGDEFSSVLSALSLGVTLAAAESLAGAVAPFSGPAARLPLSLGFELSSAAGADEGVLPAASGFADGVVGAVEGAAVEFAGGCAVPAAGCGCTGAGCDSGVIDGVEDGAEVSGALLLFVVSGAVVVAAAGFFTKTFSQGKP